MSKILLVSVIIIIIACVGIMTYYIATMPDPLPSVTQEVNQYYDERCNINPCICRCEYYGNGGKEQCEYLCRGGY
jgi:hypothetical protein